MHRLKSFLLILFCFTTMWSGASCNKPSDDLALQLVEFKQAIDDLNESNRKLASELSALKQEFASTHFILAHHTEILERRLARDHRAAEALLSLEYEGVLKGREACDRICKEQATSEGCMACSEGGQANYYDHEINTLDAYFESSITIPAFGKWRIGERIYAYGPRYSLVAQYDLNAEPSLYVTPVTYANAVTRVTVYYQDNYRESLSFPNPNTLKIKSKFETGSGMRLTVPLSDAIRSLKP